MPLRFPKSIYITTLLIKEIQMAQYKTASPIATNTRATVPRNKGVMIVNDGVGATEADIVLYDNVNGTNEVVIKAVQNHNPIIIPCTLYKTGGTLANCTAYELS